MKEFDIRPKAILDKLLKQAEDEIEEFFGSAKYESIKCPACNSSGEPCFTKHTFNYELCPNCNSLYVSPRPDRNSFNAFYTNARSVQYFSTTFFKETANARREKLWKPKAKLINEEIKKYDQSIDNIIDIGGGYGIFAEEIKIISDANVTVIEPNPDLANDCRNRDIQVIEKFLEQVEISDLPVGKKIYTSFELFEHLHDPELFLKQMINLMQKGDMFIFTTLSGTGIDIQGLWEDSKAISPPFHLNFLNPYSIKLLLERVGFEARSNHSW